MRYETVVPRGGSARVDGNKASGRDMGNDPPRTSRKRPSLLFAQEGPGVRDATADLER
jgi:hypothetical protein